MIVLFKKVNQGATYQEKIYDYWIHGQTESGLKVVLYDSRFDLREHEGKVVNCLILAFMAQDINSIKENEESDPYHPIIKGTFEGDYNVSSKWKNYKKVDRYAVSTNDGIMLISKNDLENIDLNIGDEIIFTVGRLDLLDWIPIK